MQLPKNNYYYLKKGDLIMVAAILFVAGIAALLIMHQKRGNEVIIISGDDEKCYSINENRTIQVKYENEGYNVVVIHDGMVWVDEADCSNQICVNHKPIYKNNESIVCVPHKLMIVIKNSTVNEIDN